VPGEGALEWRISAGSGDVKNEVKGLTVEEWTTHLEDEIFFESPNSSVLKFARLIFQLRHVVAFYL